MRECVREQIMCMVFPLNVCFPLNTHCPRAHKCTLIASITCHANDSQISTPLCSRTFSQAKPLTCNDTGHFHLDVLLFPPINSPRTELIHFYPQTCSQS